MKIDNSIYVFYKDHSYEVIKLKDFEYLDTIAHVLIPLGIYSKMIYVPVNPKIIKDFHHCTVSMTMRHTGLSLECPYETNRGDYTAFFESKNHFTDFIECISFIHSIFRLRGYEYFKHHAESEFLDFVNIFDIPKLKIEFFDENNLVYHKVKFRDNRTLSSEELDYVGFIETRERLTLVCKRLKTIIPSVNNLPWGTAALEMITDDQWDYTEIRTYDNISDSQFISLYDTNSYYLSNNDDALRLAAFIVYNSNKNQYPTVHFFIIDALQDACRSNTLNDDIKSGAVSVYSSIDIYKSPFEYLLQVLLYLNMISDYMIFEATKCIQYQSNPELVTTAIFIDAVDIEKSFYAKDYKGLKNLLKEL